MNTFILLSVVIFGRFSPFPSILCNSKQRHQLVKTQYTRFVRYYLLLYRYSLVFLLSLYNMLAIAYKVALG